MPKKPTLEEVANDLEYWRANKKSFRDPIPDHLWGAAVELAKKHTVSIVCKKLRLNANDLKRRLNIEPTKKVKPEITFKKLDIPKASSSTILELTTSCGMTIRVFR